MSGCDSDSELADFHAIWTFDRILQGRIQTAEYHDRDVIDVKQFAKTFPYVERFRKAIAIKQQQWGTSQRLSAKEAIEKILAPDFFESEGLMDPHEPLRLRKGQIAEVWSIHNGLFAP